MFGQKDLFFRVRPIDPVKQLILANCNDFLSIEEAREFVIKNNLSDAEWELVKFEKKEPMVRFEIFEFAGKVSGAIVTTPGVPDRTNVIGAIRPGGG